MSQIDLPSGSAAWAMEGEPEKHEAQAGRESNPSAMSSETWHHVETSVNDDVNQLSRLPVFAPLHVLVVDDYAGNRAFAVSLLEHRGHSYALAANGLEAVRLFGEQPFDAVLMDLEMPHMDGVEAARAIRQMPHGVTTPIIAMTTRNSPEDRDHCQNAGMTDFVAKPFSARDMVIILEQAVAKVRVERIARLLNVLPERPSMSSLLKSPASPAVVNLDVARSRLGNDEQLLRDMAGFYLEDVPSLLDELRDGLQSGNVELATRSAHSLKGLSANFEAAPAVAVALRIETACREGHLQKAAESLTELDLELGRVMQSLKELVMGHGSQGSSTPRD